MRVLVWFLVATLPAFGEERIVLFPKALAPSELTFPFRRATVVKELQQATARALRSVGAAQAESVTPLWLIHGARIRASAEWFARLDAKLPGARSRIDRAFSRDRTFDGAATPANRTDVSWGLRKVGATEAWANGGDGLGVVVAIVDSGVAADHPDLRGRVLAGRNFEDGTDDTRDEDGHGTAAAGIVAGNGSMGTATGIAPAAKILPVRVCCRGEDELYESVLWEALQFAVEQGADVLSMSISLKRAEKPDWSRWRLAETYILAAGIFHANSAGNRGNAESPWHIGAPANAPPPWFDPTLSRAKPGRLAAHSAMVAVGATDESDKPRTYSPTKPVGWQAFAPYTDFPLSPTSPGLPKPELCAPSEIPSLEPSGGYLASFGGTSSATPLVAGAAAVLLSLRRDLSPAAVLQILGETATRSASGFCGSGRIDIARAVRRLTAPTSSATTGSAE